MSRALRLALELLELVAIACTTAVVIAALVAWAVASLDPSLFVPAFLQAFPIFAGLVFAALLLLALLCPEPDFGGSR